MIIRTVLIGRQARRYDGTDVLAPSEVQETQMLVTKVTSELPLVEDTIDTTRHDAEEQIPVAESALKEPACHRAYQARSHSHAVQELVLQLWQVAV